MSIRKSNTKLRVDQIIDKAADILEADGWVTGICATTDGGHCAVGAVAQAVYPKATALEINDLSYPDDTDEWDRCYYAQRNGRQPDPRHVEALEFLSKRFAKLATDRELGRPFSSVIYSVNDNLPTGAIRSEWDDEKNAYVVIYDDPKVRKQSARKIVKRFRSAAEAYRKQQAKAAA